MKSERCGLAQKCCFPNWTEPWTGSRKCKNSSECYIACVIPGRRWETIWCNVVGYRIIKVRGWRVIRRGRSIPHIKSRKVAYRTCLQQRWRHQSAKENQSKNKVGEKWRNFVCQKKSTNVPSNKKEVKIDSEWESQIWKKFNRRVLSITRTISKSMGCVHESSVATKDSLQVPTQPPESPMPQKQKPNEKPSSDSKPLIKSSPELTQNLVKETKEPEKELIPPLPITTLINSKRLTKHQRNSSPAKNVVIISDFWLRNCKIDESIFEKGIFDIIIKLYGCNPVITASFLFLLSIRGKSSTLEKTGKNIFSFVLIILTLINSN